MTIVGWCGWLRGRVEGSMVTHRATEYGKPRTGVSIAPESAAAARRQHSHHIVVIGILHHYKNASEVSVMKRDI